MHIFMPLRFCKVFATKTNLQLWGMGPSIKDVITLEGKRTFEGKGLEDTKLQIFTPWKLQGLGIAGYLQGKPALSMEKGFKNPKKPYVCYG